MNPYNYFIQKTNLSPKTPWIEILYHYLEIWRKSNDGHVPTTYKEKSELRDLIKAGTFIVLKMLSYKIIYKQINKFPTYIGMTADEENYEEAIRAVNSNLGGGKATSDIRKILDDNSCINLTRKVNLIIYLIYLFNIIIY